MTDWFLNEPPPQARKRTKDSRVSYRSLRGWFRALRRIEERHCSSQADHVKKEHIAGLPLSFIQRCEDLELLEQVARKIEDLQPPRGQRAGHITTDLLVAVNNQIARLKRRA